LKTLWRAVAQLSPWFRTCSETSITLVVKRLYTAQQSSVRVSQWRSKATPLCSVLEFHTYSFICKCVRSLCLGHTSRCIDFRTRDRSTGHAVKWKLYETFADYRKIPFLSIARRVTQLPDMQPLV